MATEMPTIQVTAPGVYLNDDEFDWSVMALIPSPPKTGGGRKRRTLTYLASPSKSQALDEDVDFYVGDRSEHVSDSEEDPKVEQRTLDALKQSRSPLKPIKRLSDAGLASPSNTLQVVDNDQNIAGLRSPKKRKSENWDEEFKSPAKLAVGDDKQKLIPVTPETELDRLWFPKSPTPQFPTGAEPIRSPRKAVRRLSSAFGQSE